MSNNNDDEHPEHNRRSALVHRMRAVAEREASRLARPEAPSKSSILAHGNKKRTAVSSTPFGRKIQKEERDVEVEEWCGPFSVARQMIAAREDARRKREEEQKETEESHPLDEVMLGVEEEKKRKSHPSLEWKGNASKITSEATMNHYVKRQRRFNSRNCHVPTLFQLCVDLLVENFEYLEDGLGNGVDSTVRKIICEALVAKGRFNGAAFDVFAEEGVESLEIVDCASVTQDQLAEALRRLLPAGLKAIMLDHAGRCFGASAVDAITKSESSLFALSIGGAYLLRDAQAAELVGAMHTTLSSIDFKACPLLGPLFIQSIPDNYSLSTAAPLLELLLEDLNLPKEALCSLATGNTLHHLKNLKLSRIESVDDEVLKTILCQTDQLEGLHLSGLPDVTDDALVTIRQCNPKDTLRQLHLSGMKNFTSLGFELLFTTDIPTEEAEAPPDPPRLRTLDLSECHAEAVTDQIIDLAVQSASSLGGLASLDISGASLITDTAMESLARYTTDSLQECNVSFCPKITDQGLGYLVSQLENQFCKLTVWGCAQITDEFLDGHRRVDDASLDIVGVWIKKKKLRV